MWNLMMLRVIFQSTHLLRGATLELPRFPNMDCNFNPRTSCEVRLLASAWLWIHYRFQSTHLLRGATKWLEGLGYQISISIHAPLARCDRAEGGARRTVHYFNPRTSCEVRLDPSSVDGQFFISIHAPLARCDENLEFVMDYVVKISIHAPLARCDLHRALTGVSA